MISTSSNHHPFHSTLRCHRTRIHRNLFVAILVHTGIQLSTHIDQFVSRTFGGEVGGVMISSLGTIYNTVSAWIRFAVCASSCYTKYCVPGLHSCSASILSQDNTMYCHRRVGLNIFFFYLSIFYI